MNKMENSELAAYPRDRDGFSKGMTKRERFTMAAMQGLLSNSAYDEYGATQLSKEAISYADSQLKELEIKPNAV